MISRKQTLVACVLAVGAAALLVVAPSLAQEKEQEGDAVSLQWENLNGQAFFSSQHQHAEIIKTMPLAKEAEGGWQVPISAMRTKVPGGWFVHVGDNNGGPFFYPDVEHRWDGGSLP